MSGAGGRNHTDWKKKKKKKKRQQGETVGHSCALTVSRRRFQANWERHTEQIREQRAAAAVW